MKKLNLYILKSYAPSFIASFSLVLFFLIMQFFWLYVDDLIGKGLSIWVIIKLLYYISFSLIPIALPLSILLSSIMTFGDLAEKYELVAMKSAGNSLFKIIRPLIVLMILLAIGTFYFSNYAVPYANFKSKNLLYNITRQKPSLNLKEEIFNTSIPGYSIRIKKKSGDNEQFLEDIIIYDHNTNSGSNKSITAKKGEMEIVDNGKYLRLTLIDGYMYEEAVKKTASDKKRQPFTKTKYKKNIIYIDLSSFNMDKINNENYSNNYSMMNIGQLSEAIDSLDTKYSESIKKQTLRAISKLKYNTYDIDSISIEGAKNKLHQYIVKNTNQDSIVKASIFDSVVLNNYSSNKFIAVQSGINYARKMVKYLEENKKTRGYKTRYIAKYIMEIHKKYAFSVICIIMFFVGAPLGAIIRKGGLGMPIVVAIGIFITYQILSLGGEKLGKVGAVSPYLARWGPTIILTPFALLLTKKATNDSAIFNSELYFAPIYRLIDVIKKRIENKRSIS